MSDAQVGASLSVAAIAAMPFVFFAGKLLDLVGRRLGATVIFLATTLGIVGSYTAHGHVALTAALMLGIFGASAVMPVLNAFTAELFPTELRSEAYAWSNNLLGRLGFVVSPVLVGAAADAVGWAPAVAATAVCPLGALALIWALLPETAGRELEDTAALCPRGRTGLLHRIVVASSPSSAAGAIFVSLDDRRSGAGTATGRSTRGPAGRGWGTGEPPARC